MELEKLTQVLTTKSAIDEQRTSVNGIVSNIVGKDDMVDYYEKISKLDKGVAEMTDEEVTEFFTDENGNMDIYVPPINNPKSKAHLMRPLKVASPVTFEGKETSEPMHIYEDFTRSKIASGMIGVGREGDVVFFSNLRTLQPAAFIKVTSEEDYNILKNGFLREFEPFIIEELDKVEFVKNMKILSLYSPRALNIIENGSVFSSMHEGEKNIEFDKLIPYYASIYSKRYEITKMDKGTSFIAEYCRDFLELSVNAYKSNLELDKAQDELKESYAEFNDKINSLQLELNGNSALVPRTILLEQLESIRDKDELTDKEVEEMEYLENTISVLDSVLDLKWLKDKYKDSNIRMNTLRDYKSKSRVDEVLNRYLKRMQSHKIALFNSFRNIEKELDEKYHGYLDLFTFSVVRAYSYVSSPTQNDRIFAPQLSSFVRELIVNSKEKEMVPVELEFREKLIIEIEGFLDKLIVFDS